MRTFTLNQQEESPLFCRGAGPDPIGRQNLHLHTALRHTHRPTQIHTQTHNQTWEHSYFYLLQQYLKFLLRIGSSVKTLIKLLRLGSSSVFFWTLIMKHWGGSILVLEWKEHHLFLIVLHSICL